MLTVNTLTVIMLTVIMLTVIMLTVIMLTVIMLTVMLTVVAPLGNPPDLATFRRDVGHRLRRLLSKKKTPFHYWNTIKGLQ
jgi:hypothetical protein